jgi:cell division ATPase FtsA
LSARLDETQDAYLEAMRTDNRGAAVEALGTLRAELQGVRQAMITDLETVSGTVADLIDQAREELAGLLG